MHPNASSSLPACVLSLSSSSYLFFASAKLVMIAAAPPALKRQFVTSIDRSRPSYQFAVMFSWLTISTLEP